MKPLNFEIVNALPAMKIQYEELEPVITGYLEQYGKLTFDHVQTIAAMVTMVGTVEFEALVRIIECQHFITLEVK